MARAVRAAWRRAFSGKLEAGRGWVLFGVRGMGFTERDAENAEEAQRRHYGLEIGCFGVRCGGRGCWVFARRGPAASDLVGIYEDVGAVLITLSTSSVPSF